MHTAQDTLLNDAEQSLKELKAKRNDVTAQAQGILATALERIAELFAAHQDTSDARSFKIRLEDIAGDVSHFINGESDDLFSRQESDLKDEIETLENLVSADVARHERSFTQPY